MRSRKRHDTLNEHDAFEERRNTTLLTQNYKLREWTDNLEIGTPNLLIPSQIADFVNSSPFCRYAVSPNADRIAVINFNRLLFEYLLDGDECTLVNELQLLEDQFPEYCQIQYAESGNLLLSTRSSAEIDVFDQSGSRCYTISLQETPSVNIDLMSSISCMQTAVNSDASPEDRFLDWLYLLQYNGTFSVYKIGRLTRYCKLYSVELNVGLVSTFTLLKEYNLLLVGAHYQSTGESKPPGGLCSFRLMDGEPYVDPIRVVDEQGSWFSFLSTNNLAFISSVSISTAIPKQLLAVSTNGDVFLYDIPSTNVAVSVKYVSGPRPIQAVFVNENEIVVGFADGTLTKCSSEDLQETIVSCSAFERYPGRIALSTPVERELFVLVEKGGHREVVNRRTFFAFQLWMHTLWSSFKQLVGMAVGDAAAPLQMARHAASFEFELWYLPTRTLQQLLDRTLSEGDYDGAKKLAAEYDSIDVDVVLKREWRDLCGSNSVTVESVEEILRKISNEKWIAEACATCTSTSIEAQRALCSLGSSLTAYEKPETRVRILHNARILSACTDVDFFLENRQKSLLGVAYQMAQIGDLVGLQRLLERNWRILKPHILRIISLIPSSIAPRRFEWLLPVKGEIQIDEVIDPAAVDLEKLSDEVEYEGFVKEVNYGDIVSDDEAPDFVAWTRERVEEIDADTGLVQNCILLLEIGIQNGYKELEADLVKWKSFASYLSITYSVTDSFTKFRSLSASELVSILSQIPDSDLILRVDDVLALVESVARSPDALRSALKPLLLKSCERSSNVLRVFKEKKPEIVDKDMVIDCVCELPHSGKPLFDDMRALSVSPELCSTLRSLLDLNVKPTFRRLLDSTTDPVTARSLLMQSIANIRAETTVEWEAMKDEVLLLASSTYAKLVPRDEVLELLAKELLLSEFGQRSLDVLKSLLTLKRSGPRESDGLKLGWQKSGEVLLSLSTEAMNEAVRKNDPQLDKSRFFAHLAKEISPKLAAEQAKFLDALDLMYDLGSTMMPASVKMCDPMQLLHQIIDIGTNYKQGKKCAKLAVLLGIPNAPVATALSLASLAAIVHNDEGCLGKYISEIIKAARDIPVVHQLCVQIIKSSYVPSVLEDVYACALLNCPDEELDETLTIIEESRRSRQVSIPSNCTPTADLVPDISAVKATKWNKPEPLAEDTRFCLRNINGSVPPREAARIWSRESASVAVSLALLADENDAEEWTQNDLLQRYEQALHFFRGKLSANLVEQLPPKFLIAKFNSAVGNDTPLDRIETQGVDRERFVRDAVYREDTLLGLAMTEDDAVFNDALSLAVQFHVDTWKMHMTSLENALTSCSPAEAKRILKSRSHLPTLKTDLDRFHSSLRSAVLPLIEANEMFIAYLSLFADDQPEKAASPTLKKILEKKKDLKAKKMFCDSRELEKIVLTMPDKYIMALAPGLRKFPTGCDACDSAARVLLEGTDIRPPASVVALSALLGDDETAVIDLIASKPLDEEILYLQASATIVEATPNAPPRLGEAIKERIEQLSTPQAVPVYSEPSITSKLFSRRKH